MIKLIVIVASLVCFAVSNDSLSRSLKPGKRLIPPNFEYPNFPKVQNQSSRIVNGYDASPGQYPHQVLVIINNAYLCGGSIVSDHCILTAGHCAEGYETTPEKILIIVGRHKLSERSDYEQAFLVDKVEVHEGYNSKNYPNDIALLTLTTHAITLNNWVKTIQLPRKHETVDTDTQCVISGWGLLGEGESLSNILQYASVPVISDNDCQAAYHKVGFAILPPSMLCAGGGTVGACSGDSGGALTCNGIQQGIVSLGVGCGLEGYPNVYTEVTYHMNWICRKACGGGSCTIPACDYYSTQER